MKAFLSNSFFALHNTSVTTFFYIIFLFISFGLCWVFVAAQAFSLVADSSGSSRVVMQGLLTAGASVAEHRL